MDYKSDKNLGFGKKPALTADKEKQPIIIQTLDVRPANRRTVGIGDWRKYIKQAESRSGSRVGLYDLYKDILLDGHLFSVVEKRLLAVANADWEFVDAKGKSVDSINDWIDTHYFELLVRETLNSKMWGYTMIEFDFYKEDGPGTFLIPRKHMRPELGAISAMQTGWNIESIRQGKHAKRVLEVGDEKDLGLLMVVAQYALYKRGNIADWGQFIEVFGQPLIDAVWDGFDESQRQLLLNALAEMGGGGQLVRPAGTELNFITGSDSSQTGELWEKFKSALNSEMSKAVLGQTETTESSSSSGYAQAKEHGETEDEINKSDRKFVRRMLNSRVRQLLEANGWNLQGGRFQIKDEGEEKLSKKDKFSIDIQVKKSGIPVSDDHFYENYGIDKPDDYDALKAEAEQQRIESQKPPAPPAPKGEHPPTSKPKMKVLNFDDERTLIAKLRDFFTPLP